MTYRPIINVGSLSSGFTGEAANEEQLFPHLVLLADMEEDIPDVLEHFCEDMRGIFRDMNLDAAMTKQTGLLDGQPLNGEIPIFTKTELMAWRVLPLPIWAVVIESYQDYLWNHDHAKFCSLYETVGQGALDHFMNTGKHQDEKAVRRVFESAYKDEMKMLARLTEMLTRHLPHVDITSSIQEMEDTHVVPLLTLTAKPGYDLRDIVREYVYRKSTPELRPV